MDLKDKTCIITGANSGLGLAAAKKFAGSGADVVLVCRDSSRGKAAVADVKKEVPDAKLELMICDLASMDSIRNFVANFYDTHSQLHILFNNAAVMKSQRSITEDGYEVMFQTNYLAPVILMKALLDLLKSSSPTRIINIAVPPDKLRIDFDDLQSSKQYKPFDAFMRTKLCLLLYSLEFSKRLAGTGIIINSVNPGMFKSGLSREFPWLLRSIMALFSKSTDRAAEEIVFHATSNENQADSGKVYDGKKEKPIAPYWNDTDVTRHLWGITESLADTMLKR